jgi:hypothetical protein
MRQLERLKAVVARKGSNLHDLPNRVRGFRIEERAVRTADSDRNDAALARLSDQAKSRGAAE